MKNRPDRTFIGIDYGRRRIGIAKSDPSGTIATALTTLEVTSLRNAVNKLQSVISEHRPTALVVGYPLRLSGEPGVECREVDELINHLKRCYNGPIHKVDERLSSVAAQRVIHEHGRKTGQDKRRLDRLAAVLILQQFLDGLQHD